MIHDAACPEQLEPASSVVERHGVFLTCAQWTPDGVAALVEHLESFGTDALRRLPLEHLRRAWATVVQRFLDPSSAESEALRPALTRFSGLSPDGLSAALATVLGGVCGAPMGMLFDEAESRRENVDGGLVAVVLAGNLPALAVQAMLPALALGRPVLLKSSSEEPLFAPAFVRALCREEPALTSAVSALTWRGGDASLEAPVLERAASVVVYGDQPAIDSVASRTRGSCVGFGPKTSLGVVSAESDVSAAAVGLAQDVALFDQRGCLSVQAIYTDGDARSLATAMATALEERAELWPPGPLDPVAVAGVQQLRLEARTRGLDPPDLPIGTGTVVVEPLPAFQPSPGLRTVRIHPIPSLDEIPNHLQSWRGRLQGAALAGERAWALESALAELGISRCAIPGSLQSADALWHNGGIHPLEALSGRPR